MKLKVAKTLFVASLILIILTGVNIYKNQKKAEKPFLTSEPKFLHVNKSVYLFFNVTNLKNETAFCNLSVEVTNHESFTKKLGVLNKDGTTYFIVELNLPEGFSRVKIIPKCELIGEDFLENLSKKFVYKTRYTSCGSTSSSQTFFCLAFLTKNISICNLITKPYKRALCYAYLTSKYDFCNYLHNEQKSLCFEDLAVNWQNISFCKKIPEISFYTSCSSIIENKLSKCLSVNYKNQKDYCLTMLAIKNRNLSICNYSSNISSCKVQAENSFE